MLKGIGKYHCLCCLEELELRYGRNWWHPETIWDKHKLHRVEHCHAVASRPDDPAMRHSYLFLYRKLNA